MTTDNLYNSLSYNLPSEDLTLEEKDEIIELMNYFKEKLEKTKLHEINNIIFSLINQDYTKYNPNTKVVFPYKTKQIDDNNLEVKIDCLPIRLKRIIQRFIKLAKENNFQKIVE